MISAKGYGAMTISRWTFAVGASIAALCTAFVGGLFAAAAAYTSLAEQADGEVES